VEQLKPVHIDKTANKSIQRTVKSGVSLRYTLLLTAADARRYVQEGIPWNIKKAMW
jgi:hypothetical protein